MGEFKFCEEWVQEDQEQEDLRRTAGSIHKLMNAIEPDLDFTIELMTDFPNQQIPTLDFTLWLQKVEAKDGSCPYRLLHNFFTKDMNTQYWELEQSARAWSSKASSLAQETVRRMRNVSERLSINHRLDLVP